MTLAERITPLTAEWKGNPRFRWGVWAIVGILAFLAILELRDEALRQAQAYRDVTRSLARAQSAVTQSEWGARLDEARSLQLALENRLWKESTLGLAQAGFNDWLVQVTQRSGVGRPQLTVSAQEDEAGTARTASEGRERPAPTAGMWKVNARLSFDFSEKSFHRLMELLAGAERKVTIESLSIRGAPAPRGELLLVAYFQRQMPARNDRPGGAR